MISWGRTQLLLLFCGCLVLCPIAKVSAQSGGGNCNCAGAEWIVALGIMTGLFFASTVFLSALLIYCCVNRHRVQTITATNVTDSKYWKDNATDRNGSQLSSPLSINNPDVSWYPLDTTQTFSSSANETVAKERAESGSSEIAMEIQTSRLKLKPTTAPRPPNKPTKRFGRRKPVRKAPDPPANAKRKKWWNRTYVNTPFFREKYHETAEYAVPSLQQQIAVQPTPSKYANIDVQALERPNPYEIPN